MSADIRCFGQRLLNPFRGVAQTVRRGPAEAVSLDGIHWDIYVANEELARDLETAAPVQTSDIRYGRWSKAGGLKRGPLYPSEDFRRMEAQGAVVYRHLLEVHDRVPFPLADALELWLLDTAGAPLALLHSAVDESELSLEIPLRWRAGLACEEGFTSTALPGLEVRDGSAARHLAGYVNGRAGDAPAAQWFRREADGSGTALAGINVTAHWRKRRLGPEAFPPLLLDARGHDAEHARLLGDFFRWQAPWLLLLPGLDPATRRSLEQAARRQAMVVADQYRLYPEIADTEAVRAALVEARLRRQAPAPSRGDEVMSTFYVELPEGE